MKPRETRPDAPNPGGARWCEEHHRWECTKRRRSGGVCHGPAIAGHNACRFHAGVSRDVAKAQGQATITAWKATGNATIDYRMAVLGVLQMTWLRLAAYGGLLERQVASGNAMLEIRDASSSEEDGLIGHRYGAAGRDGRIYVQSEEIRALVMLEAMERDRVVRYAKTAHDMGISDRLTSLAERWGDVVAGRISAMLDALELTPEQTARVPGLITQHLGSIDMEAIGGSDHGARTNGGRKG